MTNKAWTYHEFRHTPGRRSYSVMEGIKPIATCKHEKDARLIVSMKETNAELLTLLKEVTWLEDDPDAPECDLAKRIKQAIAKANGS